MTARDLKTLREAFDRLRKAPFPLDSVDSEELSELHAELAQYDGHVAGIAMSLLAGAHVDRRLLESDGSRRAALDGLLDAPDASTRAEAREYLEYDLMLEEVLELARNVADRRAGS